MMGRTIEVLVWARSVLLLTVGIIMHSSTRGPQNFIMTKIRGRADRPALVAKTPLGSDSVPGIFGFERPFIQHAHVAGLLGRHLRQLQAARGQMKTCDLLVHLFR